MFVFLFKLWLIRSIYDFGEDYLQDHAKGSTLYGFKGGPAGIMKCKYVELTAEFIYPYRNQVDFLIGISSFHFSELLGWICVVLIRSDCHLNAILDLNAFFFYQGGFDMICSGRDKIETPEQVKIFLSRICILRHLSCNQGINWQLGSIFSLSKLKKLLRSLIWMGLL